MARERRASLYAGEAGLDTGRPSRAVGALLRLGRSTSDAIEIIRGVFENVGPRDPLYLFGTRWAAFVERETAQRSVPMSLADGLLTVLVCDDGAERALRARARMLELPEVLVDVEEPLRGAVHVIEVRRVPDADVRSVQGSWAALRAEHEGA